MVLKLLGLFGDTKGAPSKAVSVAEDSWLDWRSRRLRVDKARGLGRVGCLTKQQG